MRSTPGIAGKVFSAVGAERVNVIAIAQGSSECSISLVVDALETDRAIRAIHRLIVRN
jgi:aspartate kinase